MDKEQITNLYFPHVVDIVIPAYNARKTIQKPLTSTLNQDMPAHWSKMSLLSMMALPMTPLCFVNQRLGNRFK